jgi:hypothetical protein
MSDTFKGKKSAAAFAREIGESLARMGNLFTI